MFSLLKSLFRHFRVATLGTVLGANFLSSVPFFAALIGPILLSKDLSAGMVVLFVGFLLTGQVLAVSGRVLDRKFLGKKPQKGTVLAAWGEGWAEGLVMAAILVGLFSLLFNSLPFYWSQGTAFSVFSIVMLGIGSTLVLGALPYYLPVRRREGLGLAASAARAFRLMNSRPGLALGALGMGLLMVMANIGTLGLFPGFAGMAAFHQGVYDRAVESDTELE